MTIVESGWNVWVWLVGVVSRRWVWVESMGVATGCGFKDFLILLIPTPFVSVLFAAASRLFCSFHVPVLF